MKTKHALVASILTSGLVALPAADSRARGPDVRAESRSAGPHESPISARVRHLIADALKVPLADVTPSASLTRDLGADSLDCVELVMEVERTFEIDISEAEAEKLDVVGDFIALAEKTPPKTK